MKCVICKQSEVQKGRATVTLERDTMTIVIKEVPASVCPNCGEEYLDERTSDKLLQVAEDAFKAGVQVDIRDYIAA